MRCGKRRCVEVIPENQLLVTVGPAKSGDLTVKKLNSRLQSVLLRDLGNGLLDADVIEGGDIVGIQCRRFCPME